MFVLRPKLLLALAPLLFLLIAGAAPPNEPGDPQPAAAPPAREALYPAILDSWQEKVGKARRDLDNADYEGVLRKTGKIQGEMMRFALDPEPRLPGLVAQTFFLRALAMAAHANKIDALFDYHAALEIDPALGEAGDATGLAAFGTPGTALAAAIAEEAKAIAENLSQDKATSLPKVMTPAAAQKLAAIAAVRPAPLVIETVIDRMGRIRQPRLAEKLHPLLALAVLDAAREVRFESAKAGGQPVMVRFQLRIAG